MKGRKRHVLVDTEGFVLTVVVTTANVSDPAGAQQLFAQVGDRHPRLQRIWADGTYRGPLVTWVAEHYGWVLDAVATPKEQRGFQVVRRRWVVERTFSWLGHYRLLSQDHEQTVASSVAGIHVAMLHVMLRRLARLRTTEPAGSSALLQAG